MKIVQIDKLVNANIIKDRRERYGNNFPLIAALWRGFIKKRFGIDIELKDQDAAIMMTLMKVSRLAFAPEEYDTMEDFINYAWIGLNYQDYLGNKQ